MNSPDHRVLPSDTRPAGPPDRCFYCDAPVGDQHNKGCVCRLKTVVVDFTVRLVVEVPEDWDHGMVESKYNESSWCASNLVDTLEDLREEHDSCFCDRTSATFVRVATAKDEARYGCPSRPKPTQAPGATAAGETED